MMLDTFELDAAREEEKRQAKTHVVGTATIVIGIDESFFEDEKERELFTWATEEGKKLWIRRQAMKVLAVCDEDSFSVELAEEERDGVVK